VAKKNPETGTTFYHLEHQKASFTDMEHLDTYLANFEALVGFRNAYEK
jgi:hypothetical protein